VEACNEDLKRADLALRDAVVAARNGGGSWRQIAKHLGQSPQTVWERYHNEPDIKETETDRPSPSDPGVWKAGDKVRAYHPRMHPELSIAEVVSDFRNDGSATYVEVKFDDLEDPIKTHKANVFEVNDLVDNR
jgi:hypothetical protein